MAGTAMTTTDLRCSICPRRPCFSDTSHLITHIASKGHISVLFDLQVLSKKDHEAQKKLAEFNQWSNQYNIETQVAERKATKWAKASNKEAKITVIGNHHRSRAGINGSFDTAPSPSVYTDPSTLQGITLPYFTARAGANLSLSTNYHDSVAWNNPVPTSHGHHCRNDAHNFQGHSTVHSNNAESGRLKGIIYPGMDLFDIATEECKRQRNQKKDDATIQRLRRDSEVIEPIEVIYHNTKFELKRQRLITGEVESTPERDIAPKPKPRRKPLANLEPNATLQGRRIKARNGSNRKLKKDQKDATCHSSDTEIDLMRTQTGCATRPTCAVDAYNLQSPPQITNPFSTSRQALAKRGMFIDCDRTRSVAADVDGMKYEHSGVLPDLHNYHNDYYAALADPSTHSRNYPASILQPEFITPRRLHLYDNQNFAAPPPRPQFHSSVTQAPILITTPAISYEAFGSSNEFNMYAPNTYRAGIHQQPPPIEEFGIPAHENAALAQSGSGCTAEHNRYELSNDNEELKDGMNAIQPNLMEHELMYSSGDETIDMSFLEEMDYET